MARHWTENFKRNELVRLGIYLFASCASMILLWALARSENNVEKVNIDEDKITNVGEVRFGLKVETEFALNKPCLALGILCDRVGNNLQSPLVQNVRESPKFAKLDDKIGNRTVRDGFDLIKYTFYNSHYRSAERLVSEDGYYDSNGEIYTLIRISQRWLLIPAIENIIHARIEKALTFGDLFSDVIRQANKNEYWISRLGFDTTDFSALYEFFCNSYDKSDMCKAGILWAIGRSAYGSGDSDLQFQEFRKNINSGNIDIHNNYGDLPEEVRFEMLKKYLDNNYLLKSGSPSEAFRKFKKEEDEIEKMGKIPNMLWSYSTGRAAMQMAISERFSCVHWSRTSLEYFEKSRDLDELGIIAGSASEKISDIRNQFVCDDV